jgi:hypothetical protein
MKKFLILLSGGLVFLAIHACGEFASRVRQYTYPPTFHYITSDQLRSTMWRFAYHSRELRELMISPELSAAHREQILSHLEVMERTADDLNRVGWPTNHPLIDANRASLLRDIQNAQAAVRRDPPNFFLASSVSGACFYCHPHR